NVATPQLCENPVLPPGQDVAINDPAIFVCRAQLLLINVTVKPVRRNLSHALRPRLKRRKAIPDSPERLLRTLARLPNLQVRRGADLCPYLLTGRPSRDHGEYRGAFGRHSDVMPTQFRVFDHIADQPSRKLGYLLIGQSLCHKALGL